MPSQFTLTSKYNQLLGRDARGYSVENPLMATGTGKLAFLKTSLTSLSHRHSQYSQSSQSHLKSLPVKPALFGMLSLAALSIVLVLELLDRFENLDIDEFEDYLEIDLDLEIGEIEGLELDPELEGVLWDNIVDILGLVNRLEDLQI